MNDEQQNGLQDARRLAQRLRGLGQVTPPAHLLARVMVDTGIGDAYAELETPVGRVFVAYNASGISALRQAGGAETFETAFRARSGRKVYPLPALPDPIREAVIAQLTGNTLAPTALDLRGLTDFERAVLLKALEIPRGEVRPYAWIAQEIGNPKAIRAVGTALAGNPLPLLIPCHRVVRSDGRIGKYIFGSDVKRAVLAAEGAAPEIIEELARSGVRYVSDEGSRSYCFPTCGGAHRKGDAPRRTFHSIHEAVAAGYRPCRDCRPAAANHARA